MEKKAMTASSENDQSEPRLHIRRPLRESLIFGGLAAEEAASPPPTAGPAEEAASPAIPMMMAPPPAIPVARLAPERYLNNEAVYQEVAAAAEAMAGVQIEEVGEPITPLAVVPRPTARDAWRAVKDQLLEAKAAHQEAVRLEDEAFMRFDAFLAAYGQEGRSLAGGFTKTVAREQELRRIRAEENQRIRLRQEAEEKEERAAAELAEFKRRSALEAARLQQQLLQARDEKEAVTGERSRTRWCCVCGMPGVNRGRECPNRHNHPGMTYTKK